MLDRVYRWLLLLLPRDFDGHDREEIWQTYQARVTAAAQHGSGAARTERCRELVDLALSVADFLWPFPSVDSLRQDMRFGLRALLRSPAVTALAVGSLALGLGAVTAIFSALDVWLIRPIPLPNAERLISVGMANPERGWSFNPFSLRDYADWARETESVELGIYARGSVNLAVDDRAERVQVLVASSNLLDVFGIDVVLGRGLRPEDGSPDAPPVVVLTDAFHDSFLGADPKTLGTELILDGVPHVVVGVMRPGQDFPGAPTGIWRALHVSGTEAREGHNYWGVALLEEGIGIDAAHQELNAIGERVAEQDPESTFPGASTRGFREQVYGPEFEAGGTTTGLGVLFVLLIACANIANILLARGLARTHEMAVRGALGAGRPRIVQQLLVESVLIAFLGGALGLVVAHVGLDLLVNHALPVGIPGIQDIAINGRMLTLAGVLTVVSALVFGLVPALRTSKVDIRERLTEGGRGGSSGRHGRLSRALLVGEISVSLVLLVLSGLMIKAMITVRSIDLGMELGDAVVFRIDVAPASQQTSDDVRVFYDALAERLRAEPGVTEVAHSSGHLLSQSSTVLYSVPGMVSLDDRDRLSAEYRMVSATYADVVGLKLLAGRWFDTADGPPAASGVTVVSRELAERWWSTPATAVGQFISPRTGSRLQIVGVVEGTRLWGPNLGAPPPAIFEPASQRPNRYGFWVVSYETDPQQIVQQIRSVVGEMDPNLAVFGVQTSEELLDEAYMRERAAFRVFGALGALALLLTLVGVYGVIAHSVGRRMHEMGLRMALGADRRRLIGMILGSSVKVAAIGLAIGVVLSMGAGQGLSFMLAGVSPRDPLVLSSVSLLLLIAIAIASLVPARRAAGADPVRVMRGEG